MKGLQKKTACGLLCMGVCAAILGGCGEKNGPGKEAGQTDMGISSLSTEQEAASDEAYNAAAAKLLFWYEDPSYRDFFEDAARRFYDRTNIKVVTECRDTLDYIGDIYDKTMQDDVFPDGYLIAGDNLEEAYLYGLVSVNEKGLSDTGAARPAIAASSYEGKILGYPLAFRTSLFVYQNGYFQTPPDSVQAIIDYARENEPGENVEYLLEWDVNDAFFDFPFISNSVTFDKTESEVMEVRYDEEMYQKDLDFFEEILGAFSVDAGTVSTESILDNFLAGRTLCALLDTDSLKRLEGYDYSVIQIPRLNEELAARPCAITDLLVVNEFSENKEDAAQFASFVTVEMAGGLYEKTGHYSVIMHETPDAVEKTAFDAYESAVPVPDSQDAKDFWVSLEETILQYFEGK